MKEALKIAKDNKNLPMLLVGVGIVLVCIVIIIYFTFFYGGKSFDDIKNIMKNAAISYCDKECKELFEGVESVSVPAKTLISGEYMKDFTKLTNDKDTECSGEVIIKKSYDGYNYIPHLDCGKKYTETSIYSKIAADKNIVDSGDGLYELNGNKVFRGEHVNNYFKLGDTLFRVVKINEEDKSIMLIVNDFSKSTKNVWDDRYNSNVKRTDGINDYSISRAREFLDILISDTYKDDISKKAINYSYCIGPRDKFSESNDGSLECSSTLNDYISLLTIFDFINASLDEQCNSINNAKACQNYNYLSQYGFDFWFLTPVSDSTNEVYSYNKVRVIDIKKAKIKESLRFVITISGDEIYKSGNGSESKPYVIYE